MKNLNIILAAGKGTRLSEITKYFPKFLAPVSGYPLIDYVKIHCQNMGGDTAIMLSEQNLHYFDSLNIGKLFVQPSSEIGKLDNAIRFCLQQEIINEYDCVTFFVSDNFTNINSKDLLKRCLEKKYSFGCININPTLLRRDDTRLLAGAGLVKNFMSKYGWVNTSGCVENEPVIKSFCANDSLIAKILKSPYIFTLPLVINIKEISDFEREHFTCKNLCVDNSNFVIREKVFLGNFNSLNANSVPFWFDIGCLNDYNIANEFAIQRKITCQNFVLI